MISNEEETRFEKYGLMYDLEGKKDSETGETSKEKVSRQKYLYTEIIDKNSNPNPSRRASLMDETAIPELLEITRKELEYQYIRKEHVENRAGFLLACWAVITSGVVIGFDGFKIYPIHLEMENMITTALTDILVMLTLALAVISLIFAILCLLPMKLRHYEYEEREYNYKCAVEDKELAYIVNLEATTNEAEHNSKELNQRQKTFSIALWLLLSYVLAVIIFSTSFKSFLM